MLYRPRRVKNRSIIIQIMIQKINKVLSKSQKIQICKEYVQMSKYLNSKIIRI
jgi:hypothetical protein